MNIYRINDTNKYKIRICFLKVIVLVYGDVWSVIDFEMRYKLLKSNWISFNIILV